MYIIILHTNFLCKWIWHYYASPYSFPNTLNDKSTMHNEVVDRLYLSALYVNTRKLVLYNCAGRLSHCYFVQFFQRNTISRASFHLQYSVFFSAFVEHLNTYCQLYTLCPWLSTHGWNSFQQKLFFLLFNSESE